jgi:hypothetical protein
LQIEISNTQVNSLNEQSMDIVHETSAQKKSLNQVHEKDEEYHDDPANKA